jgi:hypothetical protein
LKQTFPNTNDHRTLNSSVKALEGDFLGPPVLRVISRSNSVHDATNIVIVPSPFPIGSKLAPETVTSTGFVFLDFFFSTKLKGEVVMVGVGVGTSSNCMWA